MSIPEQSKIEYSELNAGHEFPPSSFRLDSATVANYIKAVGDSNPVYQNSKFVPPTAVAAFAMAALSKGISLPPGAIHISQEIEIVSTASTNNILTSYAKISRKQKRGGFHLLAIDLRVLDQDGKTMLTGKTEFIAPESNAINKE